jgi:hypothetical protein
MVLISMIKKYCKEFIGMVNTIPVLELQIFLIPSDLNKKAPSRRRGLDCYDL